MTRTRKVRRQASCTGKQRMTREAAETAATYWRRVKQARMVAYRCRFCHLDDGSRSWHIGNRRPRGG